MPIPVASSGYLTSISAELSQMANLVHAIKTSATAKQPVSSLGAICTSLGSINAKLVTSNNAGSMTDDDRHAIGDEFLKIGNELKK